MNIIRLVALACVVAGPALADQPPAKPQTLKQGMDKTEVEFGRAIDQARIVFNQTGDVLRQLSDINDAQQERIATMSKEAAELNAKIVALTTERDDLKAKLAAAPAAH